MKDHGFDGMAFSIRGNYAGRKHNREDRQEHETKRECDEMTEELFHAAALVIVTVAHVIRTRVVSASLSHIVSGVLSMAIGQNSVDKALSLFDKRI